MAACITEDNAKGGKKNEQLLKKRSFGGNCEILNDNFTRWMQVDHSCIICGFFCFLVPNCQPAFYLSIAGFCKKSFWFSFDQNKIRQQISNPTNIKCDGYQIPRQISSDNHRPVLSQVISFIQLDPAEIMRWVITLLLIHLHCRPFFIA